MEWSRAAEEILKAVAVGGPLVAYGIIAYKELKGEWQKQEREEKAKCAPCTKRNSLP